MKPSLTREEAQARYEAEWPELNAAKERAIAMNNAVEAKKCRQALSGLSKRYKARFDYKAENTDYQHTPDNGYECIETIDELITRLKTEFTKLTMQRDIAIDGLRKCTKALSSSHVQSIVDETISKINCVV